MKEAFLTTRSPGAFREQETGEDDPFKRKKSRSKVVTGPARPVQTEPSASEPAPSASEPPAAVPYAPPGPAVVAPVATPPPATNSSSPPKPRTQASSWGLLRGAGNQKKTEDLFSAHDFDIDIDVAMPP